MDSQDETSRAVRVLVEKNLESVVSIRAFKVPRKGSGGQDGEEQHARKEEDK
jgi:hypothetical protein